MNDSTVVAFEVLRLREEVRVSRDETRAAKHVARQHLTDLQETRAENRALRDAIKQLTADVAHYMQHGPAVPAYPKAMAQNADG